MGAARAAANATESTMAREIADDINRERAGRGLPKIPVDASYSAGAQRVAESNRDRPCHACHSSDHPSGEIVWWGSDYPSSGSPIWWMGSPPHRALMLAPNATKLGVGVACNGTEHDAVAWIETTAEAVNPPATPVATKAGTGSRCKGGTVATVAASGVTSTPASVGGAVTSTTRRGATTTAVSPTTRRNATTTTRGSPSSNSGDAIIDDGPVTAAAATPFAPPQAVAGSPIASASRPLAGRGGVGALGTALLLLTFGGALLTGIATRRHPPNP